MGLEPVGPHSAVIVALMLVPLVVAIVAVVATWSGCGRPDGSVLPGRVHQQVILTLKSGDGYRGVLFEVDRHAVVLRNAEALNPDGSRLVVDGELIVLRADVAYLQRP